MKAKYLFITLATILVFTSTLKSQEQSELMVAELTTANPDTVIVNIGHKDKVIVLERDAKGKTREIVYYKKGNLKNRLSHWNILFDLGFSNYSDKNHFTGSKDRTGIDYPDLHTSKSVNVALYPIFRTFRITKNNLLNIQTGLGFDWGNYRFEDGWNIVRENGIIVSSGKYRPNGESSLSKSKLTTVYLNVPLLLNLNIPVSGSSRKHFYLSAGIIGGLKIGSHTKIKYYDSGKKEKDRSSFNLNLLRYDLTFRAGYRWIGFYFNYQMTPMFENGKAHRLFPYSVGLSFKI